MFPLKLKSAPFRGGSRPPSYTWFLWPNWPTSPHPKRQNGRFSRFCAVHGRDQQTHRQTTIYTVASVATGRIRVRCGLKAYTDTAGVEQIARMSADSGEVFRHGAEHLDKQSHVVLVRRETTPALRLEQKVSGRQLERLQQYMYVKFKLKYSDIAVRSLTCHTAARTHMP